MEDHAPNTPEHDATLYIEPMLLLEIKKELIMMNGDNNKKIM